MNVTNDYMNANINHHECQYRCLNEFNTNDYMNAIEIIFAHLRFDFLLKTFEFYLVISLRHYVVT